MPRPKAEDLPRRCAANNASQRRCGSPALPGFPTCSHHAPPPELAKQQSAGERIARLWDMGMERAEQILRSGSDSDAARVWKTLTSIVAPSSGPNAVIITRNAVVGDPRRSQVHEVIARMDKLAAAKEHELTEATAAPDLETIYDAVIVDADPEPVVQQPVAYEPEPDDFGTTHDFDPPTPKSAPRPAAHAVVTSSAPSRAPEMVTTTTTTPAGVTEVVLGAYAVAPGYGIPAVRVRRTSFEEMARDRLPGR